MLVACSRSALALRIAQNVASPPSATWFRTLASILPRGSAAAAAVDVTTKFEATAVTRASNTARPSRPGRIRRLVPPFDNALTILDPSSPVLDTAELGCQIPTMPSRSEPDRDGRQ